MFIEEIDCLDDVSIRQQGNIEELKHQDYHGKRVYVQITDSQNFSVTGKLDIGVHNDLTIEQEEYCFEVAFDDEGVTMIINSKEQIFAEKLFSLLKRATFSTRYKDIFDMYYLMPFLNKEKLSFCFEKYIYSNPKREQDIVAVRKKLDAIFHNSRYISRLQSSKKNWLDLELSVIIEGLLKYFEEF